MTQNRLPDYLDQMLEAIQLATSYAEGTGKADFVDDKRTQQAVLDARAQFPGSSLADLYDPLTMPPALVKAHQKLDAAVDAAYAQDAVHPGKKAYATDAERVAYLFELYQRLTSLLPADKPKKKR